MDLRPLQPSDLDTIRADIVDFWGSDRTLGMHQSMFIHEFGPVCPGAYEAERLVGYLIGFPSLREGTAYVHLVAVRSEARGRGVAAALYTWFADAMRARGCTRLRAITSPSNAPSIAFHRALGFALLGETVGEPVGAPDAVPVLRDYAGVGKHRVVFERPIALDRSCVE